MCVVCGSTKSTNFGSRNLGEGSSEEDEIFQVTTRGVDVHHDPDWWPLVQGGPPGYKFLLFVYPGFGFVFSQQYFVSIGTLNLNFINQSG